MSKPAASSPPVRLSQSVWAKAVIAGEMCKPPLTAGQYVELATIEKLDRQRDQIIRAKEATAPVKPFSLRLPPRT